MATPEEECINGAFNEAGRGKSLQTAVRARSATIGPAAAGRRRCG